MAIDYKTYWRDNKSSMYHHFVSKSLGKKAKCMTAQICTHTYDPFWLDLSFWLLSGFKLACDIYNLRIEAVTWLFGFFLKMEALFAL